MADNFEIRYLESDHILNLYTQIYGSDKAHFCIRPDKLDIILNEMFTEEEYIAHQKRMFINENVDATLRSEFGGFMAIGDILDAIYDGHLCSGQLKNQKGEKIMETAGHGIAYYYDTNHGFAEMVANFASISKSKDSIQNLIAECEKGLVRLCVPAPDVFFLLHSGNFRTPVAVVLLRYASVSLLAKAQRPL